MYGIESSRFRSANSKYETFFLVRRFLRALERFEMRKLERFEMRKFRNVAKNSKNVVNEGANAKISLRHLESVLDNAA